MDGSRFVHAVRRQASLVVVTAIAAVALTVILLLFLPQRYRATADVVVYLPDVQTGSAIATTAQAVSDFEGALRSAAVARAASEAAGISAGSITDGLRTEWLEGGTVVEVTFTASDPDAAETVVDTASREAMVLLLDARLAPVQHRLDNAQAAVADANEAIDAFRLENQILDIEEYKKVRQDELTDLTLAQAQAELDGDEEQAAQLQDEIDTLLQTSAPILTEYDALQFARAQAQAALTEARTQFETADGARQAAQEDSSVTVMPAVVVPRTERLPSQLLVVVVIATALTIGLIVLLELLMPHHASVAEASAARGSSGTAARPSGVEREVRGPPGRPATAAAPVVSDRTARRARVRRAEPEPADRTVGSSAGAPPSPARVSEASPKPASEASASRAAVSPPDRTSDERVPVRSAPPSVSLPDATSGVRGDTRTGRPSMTPVSDRRAAPGQTPRPAPDRPSTGEPIGPGDADATTAPVATRAPAPAQARPTDGPRANRSKKRSKKRSKRATPTDPAGQRADAGAPAGQTTAAGAGSASPGTDGPGASDAVDRPSSPTEGHGPTEGAPDVATPEPPESDEIRAADAPETRSTPPPEGDGAVPGRPDTEHDPASEGSARAAGSSG